MENLSFITLCGNTGSGKSRILRCIGKEGFQILDIEKIAGHNGSAFGSPVQHTTRIQQMDFVKEILQENKFFVMIVFIAFAYSNNMMMVT